MNRRFLLLCVAMCLMGIVPMKAQIGILLGFDQSINRTKIGSEATFQKKPALNGFKAGVFYEHNFKYGLGLYYGVNYNFLHDKTKWEGQGNGWFLRTATTLHNLDFPIHFQYKLSIAKDTYLMAYTGPTLALGLAGTEAVTKKNGLPENNPLFQQSTTRANLYSRDANKDGFADLQRFDVMISVGAGLQFKNIQLKGGYDFGLLNRYGNSYMDGSRWFDRRNEWSIRLAYQFGNWKW